MRLWLFKCFGWGPGLRPKQGNYLEELAGSSEQRSLNIAHSKNGGMREGGDNVVFSTWNTIKQTSI
jgi:hypothetical protein